MPVGNDVLKKILQKNAKIGLFSRIDYGSRGFRRGLIDNDFQVFKEEGVHFISLVSGLVDKKALKIKMGEFVKAEFRKERLEGKKYPRFDELLPVEKGAARKKELEDRFMKQIARELSELIPSITIPDPENPEKQKPLDIFIITSPTFDGEIGKKVAVLLAGIRPDIWVRKDSGDRLFVKFVEKYLWCLTPTRSPWRGRYYSTPAEGIIEDKIKTTTKIDPDTFAVGGLGSSIHKPKGELRYQYVTIPVSHRLEGTTTSENQIGSTVIEYPENNGPLHCRSYNLKDLVASELNFIAAPEEANEVQKKLVDIIKDESQATPGMFRYFLLQEGIDLTTEQVETELDALGKIDPHRKKGANWPGVVKTVGSKMYQFNLEWIQKRLRYDIPSGQLAKDVIASLSCLHAGSVETDYEFFLEELPLRILQHGVTTLVNAGDTKEGTKHHLIEKGEVIAGMNNTKQEKLAASLFSVVEGKVFKARFDSYLEKLTGKPDTDTVKNLVALSLLDYRYKLGNHDLWEAEYGHDPLQVFHYMLIDLVTDLIERHLILRELPLVQVRDIVKSKINCCDMFVLSSGLNVSIQHPFMARAKTTSLRPQEMLDYGRKQGCQVVIGGNFHVSERVGEWDPNLGQSVCMQIGTIKHGSNFERSKMKTVDQGFGILSVVSSKCKIKRNHEATEKPRIFITESVFYGEPRPKPPFDNLELINTFTSKLGIPNLI